MSEIKQYILKQIAKKNLPKEEASNLLLDLINLGKLNAQQDIAIVGMACKLPGANSPVEFWSNLERGVDAIDEFPEFRKNDILLFKDKLDHKIKTDKTFQGAFLDRIDLFDADFFGISPAEARVLDPLQRLFLSVSYHAVENAGYTKEMLNGSKMGVYVGHTSTGYKELLDEEEASSIPGNTSAILASRIAYVFNLIGPTMLVDTTCSSSMVALHLACEGIMRGDCDSAIVGGGNVILYPACQDVANQSVGILSSNYRSKAFDQSADGCGIGEGVVSLVIKPLKKAIQGCDNIYAVIKGSAINSDGRSNGITAPSAKAQTQVITKAWSRAGIKPEQISYVEAHGTGTQLGDPIEFEGLNLAFNQYTQEKQFCAIGSLKTNIGHLDSAAGLAGVLKTGLSILHHKIPSSLHFKQPNPLIDFENSALYVNQQLSEWQQGQPLLAGVSSFGLSGTNAHVVLSENLEKTTENKKDLMDDYLFVISAKSIDSLYELLVKYNIYLIDTNLRPIDVSYTMLMRRNHFQYRLAFVAKNLGDLRQQISSIKLKKSHQEIELSLDGENLYYGEVHEAKELMGHMSSLREYAQKYIEGYKLDGDDFFGKNNVHCIELPSYSFNEKRHWVLNSQKLEDLTHKRLKTYDSNTNVMHQCVSETFNFGESLISELDFNFPEGYVDDMSQFCSMLILRLFRKLNLLSLLKKGAGFDALYLKANFTLIYKKIFKVMLNHLVADCVISQKDETFYLNRLIDDNNIEEFLNECTQKYPELSDCFNFPYYCSKSYVDVFIGKKNPLNVMYPGGDLSFQYKFDKVGDRLGDIYGIMTIEAIAQYISALSEQGQRVKILEAGAGMGSLTNILLPKIKDMPNIEYHFTDLGQAFVKNASSLYSQHDFMGFNVFDITKSPLEQGLIEESYDIVLVYNVIHTTKSIQSSLKNLKTLLKPDGCIFIVESSKNEMWSNLAWGLLEGWWLFEDYNLRPYEPMIDLDSWEKVVRDSGFANVLIYPSKRERRELIEKALIIGQLSDGDDACFNVDSEERSAREIFLDAISKANKGEQEQNVITISSLEEMEDLIRGIWMKVLEYDEINVDDDFYELGGDSLLAIKKLELLKGSLNIEVEIADLFSYTTIRKQTEYFYNTLNPSQSNPQESGHSKRNNSSNNDESLPQEDDVMSILTQVENNQISSDDALENLKGK